MEPHLDYPNRTSFILSRLAICLILLSTTLLHATESTVPGSTQNAEDQFKLGRAYYRGEGVSQSFEQAGIWYRKSADQGNTKAMYNLGVLFLKGEGTKKDEVEAYHWIQKAAEKGDPLATYLYSVLLLEGKGVDKNPSEGFIWLKKSAETGFPNALARLGRDYLYGEDGITKDPAKALPLIQSAAEKGNTWAMGELGTQLAKGQLLPSDEEKSRSLIMKAAAMGDPASQYEYARFLMLTDPVKAYPWIKLSVDAHEVRSIGLMNDCRPHLTSQQVADGDAEAEAIKQKYSTH